MIRHQLNAAFKKCKRSKAKPVVAKRDRLSRNAEFLLRLQNSGVNFVCCDCPNVDWLTVGILALVTQRERELISERTKAALSAAKARGVRLGGCRDAHHQLHISKLSSLSPTTPATSGWFAGLMELSLSRHSFIGGLSPVTFETQIDVL
ncbi:MAG: recombinase family protein [Pedosphaera sp.]|nr:recombinase family protein [Pedosphaera sp.]